MSDGQGLPGRTVTVRTKEHRFTRSDLSLPLPELKSRFEVDLFEVFEPEGDGTVQAFGAASIQFKLPNFSALAPGTLGTILSGVQMGEKWNGWWCQVERHTGLPLFIRAVLEAMFPTVSASRVLELMQLTTVGRASELQEMLHLALTSPVVFAKLSATLEVNFGQTHFTKLLVPDDLHTNRDRMYDGILADLIRSGAVPWLQDVRNYNFVAYLLWARVRDLSPGGSRDSRARMLYEALCNDEMLEVAIRCDADRPNMQTHLAELNRLFAVEKATFEAMVEMEQTLFSRFLHVDATGKRLDGKRTVIALAVCAPPGTGKTKCLGDMLAESIENGARFPHGACPMRFLNPNNPTLIVCVNVAELVDLKNRLELQLAGKAVLFYFNEHRPYAQAGESRLNLAQHLQPTSGPALPLIVLTTVSGLLLLLVDKDVAKKASEPDYGRTFLSMLPLSTHETGHLLPNMHFGTLWLSELPRIVDFVMHAEILVDRDLVWSLLVYLAQAASVVLSDGPLSTKLWFILQELCGVDNVRVVALVPPQDPNPPKVTLLQSPAQLCERLQAIATGSESLVIVTDSASLASELCGALLNLTSREVVLISGSSSSDLKQHLRDLAQLFNSGAIVIATPVIVAGTDVSCHLNNLVSVLSGKSLSSHDAVQQMRRFRSVGNITICFLGYAPLNPVSFSAAPDSDVVEVLSKVRARLKSALVVNPLWDLSRHTDLSHAIEQTDSERVAEAITRALQQSGSVLDLTFTANCFAALSGSTLFRQSEAGLSNEEKRSMMDNVLVPSRGAKLYCGHCACGVRPVASYDDQQQCPTCLEALSIVETFLVHPNALRIMPRYMAHYANGLFYVDPFVDGAHLFGFAQLHFSTTHVIGIMEMLHNSYQQPARFLPDVVSLLNGGCRFRVRCEERPRISPTLAPSLQAFVSNLAKNVETSADKLLTSAAQIVRADDDAIEAERSKLLLTMLGAGNEDDRQLATSALQLQKYFDYLGVPTSKHALDRLALILEGTPMQDLFPGSYLKKGAPALASLNRLVSLGNTGLQYHWDALTQDNSPRHTALGSATSWDTGLKQSLQFALIAQLLAVIGAIVQPLSKTTVDGLLLSIHGYLLTEPMNWKATTLSDLNHLSDGQQQDIKQVVRQIAANSVQAAFGGKPVSVNFSNPNINDLLEMLRAMALSVFSLQLKVTTLMVSFLPAAMCLRLQIFYNKIRNGCLDADMDKRRRILDRVVAELQNVDEKQLILLRLSEHALPPKPTDNADDDADDADATQPYTPNHSQDPARLDEYRRLVEPMWADSQKSWSTDTPLDNDTLLRILDRMLLRDRLALDGISTRVSSRASRRVLKELELAVKAEMSAVQVTLASAAVRNRRSSTIQSVADSFEASMEPESEPDPSDQGTEDEDSGSDPEQCPFVDTMADDDDDDNDDGKTVILSQTSEVGSTGTTCHWSQPASYMSTIVAESLDSVPSSQP